MPGLRILHTADVHLGAAFRFLGTRGREQREHLKATFSRVVDLALTAHVDMLVIAGDLFDDSFPPPALVGEVEFQLGRLDSEGIWTFIVPGTHDRPRPGGVYSEGVFSSLPHVHVFLEPEITSVRLESLDTRVYGCAVIREGHDVLAGFHAQGGERWKVGVLHASFLIPGKVERDEMLVSAQGVASSGLHYLALGHWHARGDYSQGETAAFYSGPPEALEMGGGEVGSVLMVELEEGAPPRVKPIAVGKRRLVRMEIGGAEVGDPAGLYSHLRRLADLDLALEVRIKDAWGDEWSGCDWEAMEEELAPLFFHLALVSVPGEAPALDLDAYPETTVMGRFMRIAAEEIASREGEDLEVAEEALRLGLDALRRRSRGI
ncbi:MAG: DNA repair exonuclease [Actinobacteria bacterium]|nr:DNA repair exonuclease [Actinomycetota bacterium]